MSDLSCQAADLRSDISCSSITDNFERHRTRVAGLEPGRVAGVALFATALRITCIMRSVFPCIGLQSYLALHALQGNETLFGKVSRSGGVGVGGGSGRMGA